MRTVFSAATFALLGGCPHPEPPPADSDSDVPAIDTADTDPCDEPEDDDTGTDADGDGWTVEEGDCDDNDIWANPAWTEVEDDDKDNDCDGRIDEVFAGVVALDAGESARLQFIDSLGDLDDTVSLSEAIAPFNMVDAIDGNGWVASDGTGRLVQIAQDGDVTVIWDDSETEYGKGAGPVGYFGLDVHPDGYYLLTGADRLWKIEPNGASSVIAQWDCLEGEKYVTTICPIDVAVDRSTREVGLFGYFGGFGVWSETDGLAVFVPENLKAPEHVFFASAAGRDHELFALGADGVTGEYGIYRWNDCQGTVDLWGDWPDDDFAPVDFAIEDGTGDFYVTANGGWYYTVWRMVADGTYTAQLYTSGATEPNRAFQAIGVLWEED